MKVDIGLINDFLQKLGKGSEVQQILVVSCLRKLVQSIKGPNSEKLCSALMQKRTVRSARFLNLWMSESVGWEVAQLLPQLNVTESTASDLLEAMAITLMEILQLQKPSEGWCTIEALARLFDNWTAQQLEKIPSPGSHSFHLSCKLLVSSFDRISLACTQLIHEGIGVGEMDFILSALLLFALTVDYCPALLSLDEIPLKRILEIVSICLVHPALNCHREVFWRASVLFTKVGSLGTNKLVEDTLSKPELIDLWKRVDVWKEVDWQSEALLAFLSDVIPVLGREGIRPKLQLYKRVLLACIGFKGITIPGLNNGVFALGLLVEQSHEDLEEEEVLECIHALLALLKSEGVREDLILHDNVIGAIARISCHFLDPSSLETVLPLLHTSLPLRSDVEENVPVLSFWNIWFRTPEVIPLHLPGLLNALIRVGTLFQSHERVSALLVDLFGKLEVDFPSQCAELLAQLRLVDISPGSVSSMASTFGNESLTESYYRFDSVDECLKDLTNNLSNLVENGFSTR